MLKLLKYLGVVHRAPKAITYCVIDTRMTRCESHVVTPKNDHVNSGSLWLWWLWLLPKKCVLVNPIIRYVHTKLQNCTLPETNSSPLKMVAWKKDWKRRFLLETTILSFERQVSPPEIRKMIPGIPRLGTGKHYSYIQKKQRFLLIPLDCFFKSRLV